MAINDTAMQEPKALTSNHVSEKPVGSMHEVSDTIKNSQTGENLGC